MACSRLLLCSTFAGLGDRIDAATGLSLETSSVLCIPTAAYAEDNHDWLKEAIAPVRNRACSFIEFDIAGKSFEEVLRAVEGIDAVFVTGGNTYVLLEMMQKCRFGEIIREKLSVGGSYLGCSAGAILACPRIDYIGDMDDPGKANLSDFSGLGLVDFLIMPHSDDARYGPKRKERIRMLQSGSEIIVSLRDDQGLYVCGNSMEVLS